MKSGKLTSYASPNVAVVDKDIRVSVPLSATVRPKVGDAVSFEEIVQSTDKDGKDHKRNVLRETPAAPVVKK